MAGERTDRGGPWGGGTARWKGRKSGARLTSLRCRATLDTASCGSDDAVSKFWLMSDRNQSEGRRGGRSIISGKKEGMKSASELYMVVFTEEQVNHTVMRKALSSVNVNPALPFSLSLARETPARFCDTTNG